MGCWSFRALLGASKAFGEDQDSSDQAAILAVLGSIPFKVLEGEIADQARSQRRNLAAPGR